eukprot:4577542-Prorocentrum_lima.AAC.1
MWQLEGNYCRGFTHAPLMAEPDYFVDPDKKEDLMKRTRKISLRQGRKNRSSRKGTNLKKISCS